MAHPHKHESKTGREMAKHRYADGGVAGDLQDKASDAKEDVDLSMRVGADQISNNPNTESPRTYISRRHLKGDGAFDGIDPKVWKGR